MRSIVALTAALLLNATALAEDFQYKCFSPAGVGPLTIKSEIVKSGKTVRIHASATNDSGIPIRYVRFCVRDLTAKANACAGLLDRAGIWQPERVFVWDENLGRPVKSGAYEIVAAQVIKAEEIDLVRRIYVDPLDGSDKDMARDQLMAAIVNSHLFELVDKPALADATLAGRAEIWEAGSASSASGQTATSGGILGSRVAAVAGAVSNGRSQGSTKTIFDKAIVLRLTLRTGQNIWAWDGSKNCSAQSGAKCAIDDLIEFAAHPPVPPIR